MPRQPVPEGFMTPDGRKVYAIMFSLESEPPKTMQFIVPLDANGNARNGKARAAESDKHIVNVGPGDQLRFERKKYKVTAVEAYRWTKDGQNYGWPVSFVRPTASQIEREPSGHQPTTTDVRPIG